MQSDLQTLLPAEVHVKECVDIYLADLKRRIEQLQARQDELDRRTLAENTADVKSQNNIKILITKFEDFSKTETKTSISNTMPDLKKRLDVLKLLHNFEQLNKNEMLHESIAYIQQAREPIEPMEQNFGIERQLMYDTCMDLPSTSHGVVRKNGLWKKIFQFELRAQSIGNDINKLPGDSCKTENNTD